MSRFREMVAALSHPTNHDLLNGSPTGGGPNRFAAVAEMRVGVVELASGEQKYSESFNGDVAWRTTVPELYEALAQSPVDAIVFHVDVDCRDQLIESIDQARSLRPSTRLLLTADCNDAVVIAEINELRLQPGWRPGKSALTAREKQVLEKIRKGSSNREIAGLLGISLSTVNRHVENILKKLSAKNRAQAAANIGVFSLQVETGAGEARGAR